MQPSQSKFDPADVISRIMGSGGRIFGDDPWATDIELRKFVKLRALHFAVLLQSLDAVGLGGRRLRRRTFHVLGSFDARLCSLILGWSYQFTPITLDAACKTARLINARTCSGEPVKTWQVKKPEGGHRRLWAFGPLTRARQCLAVEVLKAIWGPAKYEFARRGRGRDAAMTKVINNANQKGGARWFLTADIKNCFGSFNRAAMLKLIPLPRSVIENCLFVMEDTKIVWDQDDHEDTSKIAAFSGLPQGSLASPYIASKFIEPVLGELKGDVVLAHADDILVGSRTEKEAQANMQRLGELLEVHPAGPLLMKTCKIAPLGKPIDFCGYRLRRRWKMYGGGVHLTPSAQAYMRFELRAYHKILPVPSEHQELKAEEYMGYWRNSFKLWDRSSAGDAFLWGNVFAHILPAVTAKKLAAKGMPHIKSYLHDT